MLHGVRVGRPRTPVAPHYFSAGVMEGAFSWESFAFTISGKCEGDPCLRRKNFHKKHRMSINGHTLAGARVRRPRAPFAPPLWPPPFFRISSGLKNVLVFPHKGTNPDEPGTRAAGIEIFFPAGVAGPASAKNALAEFRNRVRRCTEIAQVLRETVGVLGRWFTLFAHHRDLFFQLTEMVGRIFTFWRCFPYGPVLFPECQVAPPAMRE